MAYSSSALALTARIRTPPQQDATITTDRYGAVATTNTLVDLTAKTQGTGYKSESGWTSRTAQCATSQYQPLAGVDFWHLTAYQSPSHAQSEFCESYAGI
jgi:hypothetical protein